MQIIILGAGQVGATVAAQLTQEENELTIVDENQEILRHLHDRFDIRTIVGHAAHPQTLAKAGAENADLLLALTNNDETNMVACQVATTLFQVPLKIARLRSADYLRHPELFSAQTIPIDRILSPEQMVANQIYDLIQLPEASIVLHFANDAAQLTGIKIAANAHAIGKTPTQLTQEETHFSFSIAAIAETTNY